MNKFTNGLANGLGTMCRRPQPLFSRKFCWNFRTMLKSQQIRGFSQTRSVLSDAPYFYREFPKPAKKWVIMAEIQGAFLWWWVFWHLFTDYGHIVGEFSFPDSDSWTDEELGIPPDSDEIGLREDLRGD